MELNQSLWTPRCIFLVLLGGVCLLSQFSRALAEGGERLWGQNGTYGVNRSVRSTWEGFLDVSGTFVVPSLPNQQTVAPWGDDGSGLPSISAYQSQPTFFLGGGNNDQRIAVDAGLQYKWHSYYSREGWEAFINANIGGKTNWVSVSVKDAGGHWIPWRGHATSYALRYKTWTSVNSSPAGANAPLGNISLYIGGDFNETVYYNSPNETQPPQSQDYSGNIYPTLITDARPLYKLNEEDPKKMKEFYVKREMGITQISRSDAHPAFDGTQFTCTYIADRPPSLVRWNNHGKQELEWPLSALEQSGYGTGYDVSSTGDSSFDARYAGMSTATSRHLVTFPKMSRYLSSAPAGAKPDAADMARLEGKLSPFTTEDPDGLKNRYQLETVMFSLRLGVHPKGEPVQRRSWKPPP